MYKRNKVRNEILIENREEKEKITSRMKKKLEERDKKKEKEEEESNTMECVIEESAEETERDDCG